MTYLQAIILGLAQGLSEFLPISSSGHLALFKILFNVNTDTGLLFDIMLHVGTLLAVCIVYYKDIFYLVKEFIGIVIDCIYNLTVLIGKNGDGVYRHVVYNGYRKFVMLVIVSTIPTGILGFVASDLVTAASEILFVPGICLIITAGLLFICDRVPEGHKRPKQVGYANAFIIGICENIIKGMGWTTFSDAFTFALLIVILIAKPTGLFGEKSTDKV